MLAGSALFGLFSAVRYLIDGIYFLPRTVSSSTSWPRRCCSITSRIAVKSAFFFTSAPKAAGRTKCAWCFTVRGRRAHPPNARSNGMVLRYKVEAFVDDDTKKSGQRLEGAPSCALTGCLNC